MHNCLRTLAFIGGIGVAAAAAAPAGAQGLFDLSDRVVTVAAGPQIGPAYPGAEGVRVVPFVFARLSRPGDVLPIVAPDQSGGFALLGTATEGVSAGPIIAFQTRRRERDVGAAVGNVGFTVEPGAYVQAFVTPEVRVRAEARHGIGGHRSVVGDLLVDYVIADPDDRFVATIGPRLRLGGGRYQDRYFGVTDEVAARTGLARFDPGGGVHAAGVAAGMLYRLSSQWGVFGYAGYDRMVGAGSDSPIVRNFGSRNQFSAGVAATYSFRL